MSVVWRVKQHSAANSRRSICLLDDAFTQPSKAARTASQLAFVGAHNNPPVVWVGR